MEKRKLICPEGSGVLECCTKFVDDNDQNWNSNQKAFCDLVLLTSDGQSFFCHSVMLAAATSQDFRDILVSGWQEGNDLYLILPDFSSSDTKQFLNFVYGLSKESLEFTNDWFAFVNKETTSTKCGTVFDVVEKMETDFVEDNDNDFFSNDWDHESDTEEQKRENHLEVNKVEIKEERRDEDVEVDIPSKPKSKAIVIGLMNHKAKVWKCLDEKCRKSAVFPKLWKHVKTDHKKSIDCHCYTCEKCGKTFSIKEPFLTHLYGTLTCTAKTRNESLIALDCQECPMRFIGARNLEIHVNVHHLNLSQKTLPATWATFSCEVCWRYFHNIEHYDSHMLKFHQITRGSFNTSDYENALERYKKEIVDDSPKNELEVKEQVEDVAEQEEAVEVGPKKSSQYYCDTCKKQYGHRSGFSRHIRMFHQKDEKFRCKKCKKDDFPTKFAMIEHRRTCQMDFPCKFCGKKFTKIGLTNHITIFHDKRHKLYEKVVLENGKVKYKCDVCNKLYGNNRGVNRHKIIEHPETVPAEPASGVKPKKLVCQFKGCSYETDFYEYFSRHKKIHGEESHVCEHCGACLSSLDNLKRHRAVNHSNEVILCTECPKTFTNPVSLQRHLRMTHRDPKFKCEICKKAFRTTGHLKQHQLSHSDDRPFPCDTCGKCFKVRNKLQRHMKIHFK